MNTQEHRLEWQRIGHQMTAAADALSALTQQLPKEKYMQIFDHTGATHYHLDEAKKYLELAHRDLNL